MQLVPASEKGGRIKGKQVRSLYDLVTVYGEGAAWVIGGQPLAKAGKAAAHEDP